MNSFQTPEKPANPTQNLQLHSKDTKLIGEALIPLTIRQILQITIKDDLFCYQTMPVQYINIIARVDHRIDREARISFVLNDDTGTLIIEVLKNGAIFPDFLKYIAEDSYSRDYFQFIVVMRIQKGQPIYMCHHLNSIADHNQITRHYSNLMIHHYTKPKDKKAALEEAEQNSFDMYEQMYSQHLQYTQQKQQAIKLVNPPPGPSLKKQIEHELKNHQTDLGINHDLLI